jgi:hypothetical protein
MSKQYYISIGQNSIYFTLRFIEGDDDYYLKNLSTNKNTAINLANSFVTNANDGILLTTDPTLIVTGKIGDAKVERKTKSIKLGNEAFPLKRTNNVSSNTSYPKEHKHPTVWEWNNWKDKQAAKKMYSNPIWQDIRKTLLKNVFNTVQNRSGWWTVCKFRTHLRKYLKGDYSNGSYLQSSFQLDMYVNMLQKNSISENALRIIADIYAKQFGRRNSNSYEEMFNKVMEVQNA